MKNVHYVTYEDSVEQNLMDLVLTKERLNEFIKTGEVKEQSEIFEEFDITMSVIDSPVSYTHLNYIGAHQSIAQFPEMKERTVIVNGVSKAYACLLYTSFSPEIKAPAFPKIVCLPN